MIHPTVILSEKATIGENVSIGPYSIIDGQVEIGDGCRIGPHCHICEYTRIGRDTRIHTGAVIGDEPQDHRYSGDISFTEIGQNCILREYVTIHRGALKETSTIVEDGTLLMAFVHIGHNCHIEKGVNIANLGAFSGHVRVERGAFISGGAFVQQFVRIGQYAMVSANARINKDVPPYCVLAEGDRIYGPNVVGLRRAGFNLEKRNAVKKTIKLFFFSNLNVKDALTQITNKFGDLVEIKHFVDFIKAGKRGTMNAHLKRDKGKSDSM